MARGTNTAGTKVKLLNDNDAGTEGIHLMIGLRPAAAFGNSTGDQQMLEYTAGGDGLRLKMLGATEWLSGR